MTTTTTAWPATGRTPPPPSRCQCTHVRIVHRGGRACAECKCRRFAFAGWREPVRTGAR